MLRTPLLALVACVACSRTEDASNAKSAAAPSTSAASSTQAATTAMGALSGRVVFKGKVSPPKEVDHPQDPFCEKAKPKDPRTTRVGKDSGLLDVVVRLQEGVKGDPALAPAAVLKQDGCTYVPRVFGVVAGGEYRVENADRTMHNVHGFQGTASVLNFGHAAGEPPLVKKAPTTPGIVRVKCDVHPWMAAWMVVSDHPFFASTDDAGRFSIPKAPSGEWSVEAFHPIHGTKTARVKIEPGGTANVELEYTDADKATVPP